MDAREREHRNSQEAYARRHSSVKGYQQDQTQDTTPGAEQQRLRDAEDRAAYLARREARLKEIVAANAVNRLANPEEPAPPAAPDLPPRD